MIHIVIPLAIGGAIYYLFVGFVFIHELASTLFFASGPPRKILAYKNNKRNRSPPPTPPPHRYIPDRCFSATKTVTHYPNVDGFVRLSDTAFLPVTLMTVVEQHRQSISIDLCSEYRITGRVISIKHGNTSFTLSCITEGGMYDMYATLPEQIAMINPDSNIKYIEGQKCERTDEDSPLVDVHTLPRLKVMRYLCIEAYEDYMKNESEVWTDRLPEFETDIEGYSYGDIKKEASELFFIGNVEINSVSRFLYHIGEIIGCFK